MNNKRVIIVDENGNVYIPRGSSHQEGYTFEQAKALIATGKLGRAKIYFIEEELKKYIPDFDENFRGSIFDTKEEYQFATWRDLYMDRNINVDTLPQKAETNADYEKKLFLELDTFLQELQKPPFVYETDLINIVKKNCCAIKAIFTSLKKGNQFDAEMLLKEMLKGFTENSLFYSDLDKSYAFRGIAPFPELHSDSSIYADYEKMMKTPLTFFRLRTKKPNTTCNISSLEDIVHLPYNKRDKASKMRFSNAGVPCLYLGVTSLVCAQECHWKIGDTDDIYASVFIPNDKGKKLKILSLTFPKELINGIQHSEKSIAIKLQSEMIKLYPLLLATSFTVTDSQRDLKYEYLIPQCLMKVMHEVGIDGIAYLSAQGKDGFQYPQGVNLALPAYDISDKKQFSKYCTMFDISKPVKFENQDCTEHKSYINSIYEKYLDGLEFEDFSSKAYYNGTDIYYGETELSKFDNYLCSLKKETFIC